MVIAADNLLGVGLYSLDEIAMYARVSKRLAKRWFFGTSEGKAAFIPRVIENKFITFLDFVQMMAIREILNAHPEVTLEQIRQLLEIANQEQKISHPFARKGITFLWHNELGLELPDGTYVEASGKHRRNTLLKPIVMFYKEDLGYDDAGIAQLYHAWRWEDCVVDMNPHIRFGAPIVTSCGYSAETLREAAVIEGSMEAAAKIYGVQKKEVEAACRYFDMLSGKAA